jgi:tRNA-splicing ligase RtcB
MVKTITSESIPIKIWADKVEKRALDQAFNLANHPKAFHHVALMPDTHEGFGMPIGGVLATKGAIIPNAVGVDIGCGLLAIRTSLKDITENKLSKILAEIRKLIPVGFNHHKSKQNINLMPKIGEYSKYKLPVVEQEYNPALYQLGTLGGGNHFIEIQKGNDGFIWIMIHTGSRNIGYKVANHYNKLARSLNKKWVCNIPDKWDLAYLPLDDKSAVTYNAEMKFCIDFARANRELILNRIKRIVNTYNNEVTFHEKINIAHNYASKEKHFGNEVIVHRKGAIKVDQNTIGIVPGSQGTNSYIVKGKGNKDSYESCAHGAGRRLGRRQARRQLNLKYEKNRLDNKGIIHSIRSVKDLDEAPSAYKDITKVMRYQDDLVEQLIELTPLGVIKG